MDPVVDGCGHRRSLVRRFMDGNVRLAWRIERRLPHVHPKLHRAYQPLVADYMNRRPGQLVVDVGGGRRCAFAHLMGPGTDTKIIALDISPAELGINTDVKLKVVADACALPIRNVDLIVSHSVVEHVRNSEAFIRESARALKPGGIWIAALPGKFSLHAILNKLIGHRLAKTALRVLVPGSEGRLGFPAYYDRCYPSALRRILARHGFEVVDFRLSYYQSNYYAFFVPFYLLSVFYELLVRTLGAKNLAAALLVVAKRKV